MPTDYTVVGGVVHIETLCLISCNKMESVCMCVHACVSRLSVRRRPSLRSSHLVGTGE